MKKLIIILLTLLSYNTKAQPLSEIAGKPINAAVIDIGVLLKNKISDSVQLIGIGNISFLAKESTKFTTDLSAFFVSKMGFKQVILMQGSWLLQPLNQYLTDSRPADASIVDSLVDISFATTLLRTKEFRQFIVWLKRYNLTHPRDPVNLLGVNSDSPIPASYFLTHYIFPADKESGVRLSRKWITENYSDSMCFKDVKAWHKSILENTVKFNENKSLLLNCGEDIEHNNKIIESLSDRFNQDESANLRSRLIATDIIKNLDKKSIFYSSNEYIAKSDLNLMDILIVTSPSVFLDNKLQNKYYTFLTDFADTSYLDIANSYTREFEKAMVPGTMLTKKLFQIKSFFTLPHDSIYLKNYAPGTIVDITGANRTIVPDKMKDPLNALFIFNKLTPATLWTIIK